MEHEQIFSLLFNQDEYSWQNIIYDLVKTEQMDPWDVDVSVIAHKFLEKIRELREMDLRLSGKVVLASAIFLKIKSNKLMDEDINALDSLIASAESTEDVSIEEFLEMPESGAILLDGKPAIYPRTPQPRKRKISIFDLVNALEKAVEVQNRRQAIVAEHPVVGVPDKPRDITLVIRDVYNKITKCLATAKKRLTFDLLLPSQSKEDKVFTFIPLLHLDTMRKIDLLQKQHFGEIEIKLLKAA